MSNQINKKRITPSRIIYNDPATIVFWEDGSKTVVKRMPGEAFNKYTAFCAALAKKVYGNNSRVTRIVKSGIDQQKKHDPEKDIPMKEEEWKTWSEEVYRKHGYSEAELEKLREGNSEEAKEIHGKHIKKTATRKNTAAGKAKEKKK